MVVVLHFEHDGRPPRDRPALVDAGHGRFDFVLVGQVLGQALSGRVGQGHEHHPLTTMGLALEQLVEGPEAPEQVLRQFHPVDPHDDLPVGPPDPLLEMGQLAGHRRLGRRGPQAVGVGGQGRDEGGVALAPGGPEEGQPLSVGGRPPLGVEAAGAEPGHGGQQLGPDRGRQHPQHRRVGERGVAEVRGAQIGPEPGQGRAHQGEVVVLHQDPPSFGGHLGHGAGEQFVELAVCLPRLHPPVVATRSAGRVEQVVVAEPEGRIRDHVVGHAEHLGIRVHELDPEAVVVHHPGGGGRPVRLAQGTGHPGGTGALHRGVDRSGQPAPGGGRHRAAILEAKGQGSPVGNEHGVAEPPVPVSVGAVDGHGGTLPGDCPAGSHGPHPVVTQSPLDS